MEIANINSFLKFGYFLGNSPKKYFDLESHSENEVLDIPESELIKKGGGLWNKIVSNNYSSNKFNVVPLSGGFDSRAILGALLKQTEAKNISTYTFGVPGTFDYEIGNLIARKVGTNHKCLNLEEYKYTQEELIDISRRVNYQTILFHHGPVNLLNDLFGEAAIWSGAIIDVFFGRHTHLNKANDLFKAKLNSFNENIYVQSIDLTCTREEEFLDYVDYDSFFEDRFSKEHIIDLLNRQLKFIAPHVLMDGFKYQTMLDEELISFALSLEEKYLENQYLYKKIFLYEFPDLFSYPTKTTFGLPLDAHDLNILLHKYISRFKNKLSSYTSMIVNPHLNYIDFNKGIREREDLKSIVYQNIMDLKGRKILDWIDIDSIWNKHILGNANHSDALITLTSLEIHLKNGLEI